MTTLDGAREYPAATELGPGWPEMRIDRMRVRVFEARSAPAAPMSFASLWPRRMCLVELHADGLTGVGETWINHPSWAWAERLATLREGVAPLVEGSVVSDPGVLLTDLRSRLEPVGRQWGAPGPIWQAISGVELALWDLVGRAQGRSIGELVRPGGVASSLPVYASGVGPDNVAQLVERSIELGFTSLKVKVGFGVEQDTQTLRTVRRVGGPDLGLFVDANQAWTVDEAVEMTSMLDDYGVAWCEEPTRGNVLADLEELHDRTSMPLATGENLYGMRQFEPYLSSPAVSFIQPDVSKTGGISEVLAVGGRAAETRTGVSLHCYSGIANLAASVQLAATFETLAWVEVDVRVNPLRTDVVTAPLELGSGALQVPRAPGLGVEFDADELAKFEVTT